MLFASPFLQADGMFLQTAMLTDERGSISTIPAEFADRLSYYDKMEKWFTGKALEEMATDQSGKEYSLYPLRFNPLPTIVGKHTEAVMGISSPGALPVRPYVIGEGAESDEAQAVQAWLLALMRDAGGASALQSAIRRSEVYGGVAMRAIYRRDGLHWEYLHPRAFFVVPNASWADIVEAWVVKTVSAAEAKRVYGVTMSDNYGFGIYVEHWTPERIRVTIDDAVVRSPSGGEYDIANPYGFVPFVYIPHMASVTYWGKSLFEDAIGLLRELNLRYADIGRAINLDTQEIIVMRNSSSPRVRNIGGRAIFDLGSSTGVNSGDLPDMFAVQRPAHTTDALTNFVDELFKQILRVTDTPPIAFGDDEGSQRSSMTLEMRFWPLLAHADEERRVWSEALHKLSKMSAAMAQHHAVSSADVPFSDAALFDEITWRWDEQLPRDIKTVVDSAVARVSSGLGAPIDLLTLFPDVRDPKRAEQHIREWIMFIEQAKAEAKAQAKPEDAGSGQSGSHVNQDDAQTAGE